MQRIAIAGLGIIGAIWAKNLHDDGLDVRGWNRSPKDFPFYQPDLVRAMQDAEMILIVVADPPAVQAILDVIVPHLKPGQVVVQSSTISAQWSKTFAAQVEATGAQFLEAPFTGSKPAAEGRKTVFYLGGEPPVVDRVRPVLQRLSAHQLHVGPLGSASSLKLAMNLNIAIIAQALSEALTLVRTEGISDEIFFEALHMNVGRSGLTDLKEQKWRARDYSPQFSVKHMDKDLRLLLETAGNLKLPLAESVKALYSKGIESGLGEEDFSSLIRLLESSQMPVK